MCYNYVNEYALLSYMEYPIIIVQEYILIYLVLKYKDLFNTRTYIWTCLYFATTLGFILRVIPKNVLMYIIVSNVVGLTLFATKDSFLKL